MTTSSARQRWLLIDEAAAHVRVCADTLRDRMKESNQAGITAAWMNVGGSGCKARWQFDADEIDRWWLEINTWRASMRSRESSGSDGATPGSVPGAPGTSTRESSAVRLLPVRSPKSTSARSKKTGRSAERGNLVALFRSPTSRTS